jgi:hypothetical protein
VNEVAAAVQQVAQVVPPPLPPALPPASAGGSSAPVDAFTSAPAAALAAPTVQQGQIDNGPVTPTVAPGLDETPRHGSDALLASWVSGATAAPQRRSSVLGSWRARGTQELRVPALQRAPLVLVELTRASSAADQGDHSGGAGPATTRSLPPPVPAPSPDAPLSTLVAMAPAGPPQPGGSGVVALATGGLGLFLLFFASYLVPLSRAVRARAGVAEPHPPG